MNARRAVAPIVVAAVLLVAAVGGSSPAARTDPTPGSLDLLASAHPTSWQQRVSDTAYDVVRVRGTHLEADTAALASTTCDACVGESSALQVVYARRSGPARLDNVANAWAQGCRACTSTSLAVQVVVLRGRPEVLANNRALSVTAACDGCRAVALAFQVVLVADAAVPLSDAELAELRAWVGEQEASLRASVAVPFTDPQPTPTPTLTPSPTSTPTPSPTETPTLTPATSPPPTPTSEVRPVARDPRRARRDALSALDDLTELLTEALHAETVSADVDLSH